MTEYKCGSAKSCKYGDMCKPNFNICVCSHYKAEEPQTNEKWFCSLSTEEKAKALETIIRSVLVQRQPICHDVCNREFWETWLKEKHREE